jgi:hypothetical protein
MQLKRLSILALNLLVGVAMFACDETNTTTTTTTETTTTTTSSSTETTTTTQPIDDLIADVRVVTPIAQTDRMLEIGVFEPAGVSRIAALGNPYDYDFLKIQMELTSPSGATIVQNGFWYKEYDELWILNPVYDAEGYLLSGSESLRWKPDGISHYMVRITPKEAGLWTYRLNVVHEGVTVQILPGSFSVLANQEVSQGMVQIDEGNGRNFIYAGSGQSYYPMGPNLGWYNKLGSQDFHNWFQHIASVNGNYARIWMAPWSFALHKLSYDNFDQRQNMAIRLDLVFEKAREEGIQIQLALLNHGQFSATVNPDWGNNPFNSANGGFLDYPIQFFVNAEARRIYKNQLLYLLARYGYSEHLLAWELFNEVDWIDGYNSLIVSRWHREMGDFIKANDPYDHLVTTSYKTVSHTDAYAFEAFDYVSVHSYDYDNKPFYPKLISEMEYLWNKYQKPVLFGEIGIDWVSGNGTYLLDPTGITIRQGAWGGLMGGGAGAGSHWWWDSWIEKYDLWDAQQGASIYADYLDLAGKTYTELRKNTAITISNASAGLFGYQTDTSIYGYVYHKSWQHYQANPTAIDNLVLTIPLASGEYQFRWFNALTGEITSTTLIQVTNGVLTIQVPSLQSDIAFIVDAMQ